MKFTTEQAVKFLKLAGLADAEVVAEEAESTYNQDTALKLVDTSRTAIIQPQIEASLKDSLIGAEQGKLNAVFTAALVKATGASRTELDKLQDVNEKISHAVAHKTKSLEGNQKEVEERLNEILTKHSEETEALKTEYEGKISEATNKYVQRDIQNYLAGKLGEAPLPAETDRLIAANDFQKYLADKYHVSYDEAGKLVKLYDKANTQMPALNESKTNPVDIMQEAESYFKPRGLWHNDMRKKNPKEELNKLTKDNFTKIQEERKTPLSPIERANEERRAAMEQRMAS